MTPTTGNIAVTGSTLLGVVISSYSNVSQGAPIGNTNSLTQNGMAATSSSLPVTSAATGNIICDCLGGLENSNPTAPTFTVDGSQTQIGGSPVGAFKSRTTMSRESGVGAIDMDYLTRTIRLGAAAGKSTNRLQDFELLDTSRATYPPTIRCEYSNY